MDFEISAEQRELKAAVRAFAREELNHDLEHRDHEGCFPRECWQKCAEFGLLGLPVPSEFGGQSQDLVTTTIAMEALGWGCRDNGLVFSLNAQMWAVQMPLVHYGSEEQKRAWLPRLVNGKAIGAHAITEPGAGSDVFSLTSRAVRRDGGYVLNGQKTFATNAPVADVALAFAYLQRADQTPALTAFLVPRETKGVTFGKPIAKMGLRTSPMGEVIFEDCFVPETARLGPEGAGMRIFNSAMEWERACIFAGQTPALTAFLVPRETKGVTFGKPIAKMGLRTSPMGEVIFEDCFVPDAARLGPEGAGMRIFNSAMEWERACIFAGHLGAMERLLDDCIAYTKKRKQFGQPIAKFASVADRIADMKVAIEAGRWLLYRVGWLTGQGKSAVLESAMAKLFVSEMHSKAALDALQLHGGYGYMKEYPIEREVRDALSGTLYSGTSEMQRKIIASCLGL